MEDEDSDHLAIDISPAETRYPLAESSAMNGDHSRNS